MFQRKTSLKVRRGKVQKKNRTTLSADYFVGNNIEFIIDRQKPGEGYRHVLLKRDVENFISILPDWSELSRGLHAVVLAPGEEGCMGWHTPGVIGICAWGRDLWQECEEEFFNEHKDIIERIGVESEKKGQIFLCKFTESSAAAFQLLHIFLHELGHHHDRMSTRSQKKAARGESYAEAYARRYEAEIFDSYVAKFGL